MKKTTFSILLLIIAFSATALAIPARNGVFTYTQPDGSTVRFALSGDEFTRFRKTEDGCAIVLDRQGYYCYARYDIEGRIHNSGIRVRDDNHGGAAAAASRVIPAGTALSLSAARRTEAARLRNGRLEPATKAGSVKKKAVIILAQFQDLKFKYGRSYFVDMLTGSGYRYNGAEGSALEYFNAQFEGAYEFEFTVSPVVTLSKGYAYYGRNDSEGNDENAAEAVAEACRLASSSIDFSQFDGNGDGEVDNVFVFVAGHDEAEGASEDHIWSHQWYLLDGAGIRLSLNGKIINSYAISTELTHRSSDGTEIFATIGTFCHEYSHSLGLMDLYDTDYAGSGGYLGLTNPKWYEPPRNEPSPSLMDHGNYNNDGNCPPNYNAMELETFGLGIEESLKIGQYTLSPLSTSKRYFRYNADTEGEYYLFECRATEGWDKYIGGSGMLIYHVDKSNNDAGYSDRMGQNLTAMERWYIEEQDKIIFVNEINCNPDHQCFDLVEAIPIATQVSQVFWPNGYHSSFSGTTTPSFTFWSGEAPHIAISGIRKSGSNVVFSVTGPLSIEKVEEFQDAATVLWSMTSGGTGRISLSSGGKQIGQYDVDPYSSGSYSYTFEKLQPKTEYTVTVHDPDDSGQKVSTTFTTKSYYSDGYPFIYLNSAERNSDGSFKKGTQLPLRVFNARNASAFRWSYSTGTLSTDGSGYYTVEGSGPLSVSIDYEDGSRDIISKYITVK